MSLVTAVNDFSAVAWRSTDSVYLMSLEVVSLLKAFQNDKWSESDVVVGGAEPPVT